MLTNREYSAKLNKHLTPSRDSKKNPQTTSLPAIIEVTIVTSNSGNKNNDRQK